MKYSLCAAALLVLITACTKPADSTSEKTVVAEKTEVPVASPAASDKCFDKDQTPAVEGTEKPESPALKVTTFDCKPFDLSAHRGKWVVVNFWATWCEPCKKEIPEFNALDAKREDVEFIGLAYEEIEAADMEAFLKLLPINYPMAVLDVNQPPADFEIPPGLPLTYVIAPDGKIASKFLGPVTGEELEKAFVVEK